MITVEEYIANSEFSNFNYHLYDKWLTFAPKFDFKLNESDWSDIFMYLMEGTYELNRINNDDVQGECIVTIPQCDCFYGIGLIEDYTIYSINEVLKENNINKKYNFDYKFKQVNEKNIIRGE